MKKFFKNIFLFVLPIFVFFGVCILSPATPKVNKSLLYGQEKKDSLMENVPERRIIFVGGSNLSFGINSEMIKQQTKLNPINNGLHASFGLVFMMQHTLKYIKKDDIIVLIPEYTHFFDDYAYGGEELYRLALDVNLKYLSDFNYRQLKDIISYIPQYSLTKIDKNEYGFHQESEFYSANSFNGFGDAYKHWGLEKRQHDGYGLSNSSIDENIIGKIDEFRKKVEEKGATFLISFPGYEITSYNISFSKIMEIEAEYKKNRFEILGSPSRYAIPDSLTFDTPYHLRKQGADYRTKLLIDDLKNKFPNL